jgi:hypothetical protein
MFLAWGILFVLTMHLMGVCKFYAIYENETMIYVLVLYDASNTE